MFLHFISFFFVVVLAAETYFLWGLLLSGASHSYFLSSGSNVLRVGDDLSSLISFLSPFFPSFFFFAASFVVSVDLAVSVGNVWEARFWRR